ncbi:MAG: HEAT repeat domain-containing protein [Cyanobacteria bacterium P01_A01_bin.84]
MSNTLNSQSLSQEETDVLLQAVNEQITLHTFDTENHRIMKQMVESLGDKRGMVRLGFAEALGEIGEPATPFLIEALANHSNVVVRRAAAKTLTLIGDPNAVPHLVHALLTDEDTVVKGSSVGALARTGEPAVTALLSVLASPDTPESTKGHAAWALSFIGTEAKEYLYPAINSELPEVRCAVVGAIYNIAQENIAQETPDEKAFEILMNALMDPSEMVRSESASTIGKLKYKPAIPTLVKLLEHPEEETRKAASLALMKISDRIAIVPLQSALDKEQVTAVQSIIKLAISQLERQSEENDW